MAIDVADIKNRGWYQGAVFTADSTREILADSYPGVGVRLILATHDCDLVHRGTQEPLYRRLRRRACQASLVNRIEGKECPPSSYPHSNSRGAKELRIESLVKTNPAQRSTKFAYAGC